MVNFDSDTLLTTNKGEILNLIILGDRDDLLSTMEKWRESCISNGSGKTPLEYKVRSKLFKLFKELQCPLERNLKKDVFEDLKKLVYSNDHIKNEDIINSFDVINEFLDKINLIKIDTKKNIDSRRIEEENSEKGL